MVLGVCFVDGEILYSFNQIEDFQELDRYRTDFERLQTLHTSASETACDLDTQKRQLREDLKESKNREQRLLNDYSELEEENISLQKQVPRLFHCCVCDVQCSVSHFHLIDFLVIKFAQCTNRI